MQTWHGDSQGTEQSSSIREMNDSMKEKSTARSTPSGDSPNSSQSDSHSGAKVSTEQLRRSSRAKFAPIPLVLSGGNSKTYGPLTSVSTSHTIGSVMSTVTKVPSQGHEYGCEEAHDMCGRNRPKITEDDDDQKVISLESSEDDRASILPSSQSSMMVTRFKRSKSPSTTLEMLRTKRAKGVADLDEATMIAFKEFLHHHRFDALDEDELIGDTLSILKAANEKARTFPLELLNDEFGSDDESIFDKCLDVEETHAIGQDFLREIVSGIGQGTSGSAKKSNHTGFQVGDMNKVLVDQKTVAWIRRATGLHRHTSNAELTQKYSSIRQEPHSALSRRVGTRQNLNGSGVSNTKKRHRGLGVMIDAIAELEKDFGTHFPVYRFRSSPPKKKKPRRSYDDDAKKRKKKDRRNSVRKIATHNKVKKPSPRICTALRVLDEAWRFQTRPCKFRKWVIETETEYLTRRAIPLHPQFVKAGIVHRLPTMNSFLKNHERNVLTNAIYPLPNPLPSDEDTHFDALTSLEVHAQFAKYEFFYSDLDIEWYRENVVATTLGLPLDAPLSHCEWKSIRRRCKLVPRRFSKQFIASELMERNKYRRIVRSVQNNPQAYPVDFRYKVYKPILAGNAVKVYCKMHHTIQSGIVVSYDPTHAIYLVEFQDELYGYEYCPDSDVASCGTPRILIHKSVYNHYLECNSSVGQLRGMSPYVAMLLHCSAISRNVFVQDTQLRSPATIKHMELMLEQSLVGFSKLFEADNNSFSTDSKKLLKDAANHDAFLTLLEVIDTAGMRKSNILSLIADTNTLAIDFLPFGEDYDQLERADPVLSKQTKDYLQWLHDNLHKTSQILHLAMEYFQTLYGEC